MTETGDQENGGDQATGQDQDTVELGIEGISRAKRVGQGGFGVVYRARQEAFGRTVAVKTLGAGALDADTLRRFEHECRAVGALSGHPNIVAVYDSGMTPTGQLYLVMDYLPGGTLAQRLARDGPLGWQEVTEIGVKLAGALAAAHAQGVLHRDLKPDNVLVSAYGEPQVVDFGVARIQGGTETRTGVITGSLAHAAPEVLSGKPAEAVSDVYSLASTLHALLSGQAPFARPSDETFHPLLSRILTEDPPDLRTLGVPAALCEAIEAALVKDPAARTPNARAFGEALQEVQRGAGLSPTPLIVPTDIKGPGALADADTASHTRIRPRPQPVATPAAAATPPAPPRSSRRRLIVALVAAVALLAGSGAWAFSRDSEEKSKSKLASETKPTTSSTTTTTAPTTTTTPTTVTTTTTAPPATPAPTTSPPPPAVAPPTTPPPPSPSTTKPYTGPCLKRAVCLYQDTNAGGTVFVIVVNTPDFTKLACPNCKNGLHGNNGTFNDQMSSWVNNTSIPFCWHSDINYGGNHYLMPPGNGAGKVVNLPPDVNDMASSISIGPC
jgi:serine/threonine protein kinase